MLLIPARRPLVKNAIRTRHTRRWIAFATHPRGAGNDIRTVQELLRRKDASPTMISTHVSKRGPAGVVSPLDRMARKGGG